MIQELLYHDEENTERCFSNPPVIVKENKRSPLLGYAGIVPVRNLIKRLDIPSVLDIDFHGPNKTLILGEKISIAS